MENIIKKDLSKSDKSIKITKASGCAVCNAGAACLIDGPFPDFEVTGVSLVFNVIS